MREFFKHLFLSASVFVCISVGAGPAFAARSLENESFDVDAIVKEAADFFGVASEELAKVIAKSFKEHGRPNGYIKGSEASGAIGIGLRVGNGTLYTVDGKKRELHWEGPSIGLDIGVNASKVLMLVYKLKNAEDIFRKYKGVEGSVYVVAGVGVNYLVSDELVIAPIRVGVGWRQGANVGFIRITPKDKDDSSI